MFDWGIGSILAISRLAIKVHAAYKDGPIYYRYISEEVLSLQIIIDKAVQHFEITTLSGSDRQLGQEILEGCQNVLENLNSLIEKYNSLASANSHQAFKRVKLGAENITTLRARLVSSTVVLNDFIQRLLFLLLLLEYILISLLSCKSRGMREIRAELADILGLYCTNARVSFDSITSSPRSMNTKKAYKKFCNSLYEIGVTIDMIRQKKKEVLGILRPQETATGSQVGDSTINDRARVPAVGDFSGAETRNIPEENRPNWDQFRFGWVRPPIDFLVGPLVLTAAKAGNTKHLISTLEYICSTYACICTTCLLHACLRDSLAVLACMSGLALRTI